MNLQQLISWLRSDESFGRNVRLWHTVPAAAARTVDFPEALDPRLRSALVERGIPSLYTHQARAIEQAEAGRDTVVVTPTASGKTLCYNLPVLQRCLGDPEARALYLFPTKALSQDQMNELHGLIEAMEADIKTYTFDGDTPAAARRTIRSSGHVVVTNPDMLHQGILPHHTAWVKLFENLRYVVIDELHHYRGVFGSHVANVIRRLQRICAFYGSNPTFICCSATIANPEEHAARLLGRPAKLVDDNGAPRGTRHLVFYNPPVVNAELGIRRSVIKEAVRIARPFLETGVQVILFGRSRVRVELLLTYLRQQMVKLKRPADRVRAYRGGYLPNERRAIEKGLRDGKVLAVASTNALELGIDIGQLDVCIMAGYAGTVASTWQQAGRAGRRRSESMAILVASSAPIDQYVIEHPEFFLESTPEQAIIDPDNLAILLNHLKCAAFEIPFAHDERFGDNNATGEMLQYLADNRVLSRSGDKWHWMADTYPAEDVSLRSAVVENVVIVDTTRQRQVIGETDLLSAQLLLHDDAIYLHQGRQYHVDQLDWERKEAYVREVKVEYYTDAQSKGEIHALDEFEREPERLGARAHGEIGLITKATMFKKIKLGTHENLGAGRIHLPELEHHTTSYWWQLPPELEDRMRAEDLSLGDGLKGLANLVAQVAPLFLMADPADVRSVPMIKSPMTGGPTLFVYDTYPGGVGFSRKLFDLHPIVLEAAHERLHSCACEHGCPSCVGSVLEAGDRAKSSTARLLALARADEDHDHRQLMIAGS
ncbi:MAG TPA: DEAD/DEAH box helicase [Candidatus Krumholzibacteria bacterium]|nr:DEAD/DEAH box helicase [Candidatus Krumholzibacteria bacterium]